ncbi:MAG: hypothetical protein RL709_320 [Pseudomonadota bacterium]|jgi:hypothetical protein
MNDILYCDGLEEALVGTGTRFTHSVAVYDKQKVLEILQKDMTREEAEEYFDFNIAGAYVGESTPIFLV